MTEEIIALPKHRKPTDITGNKYGKTKAISFAGNVNKKTMWTCLCECGTVHVVAAGNLQSGNTKSCGCHRREASKARQTTHGMAGSPEHMTWRNMINRCTNPITDSYKYYGARGISVCERWRRFDHFFADMGVRPTPDHSIDRSDCDADYCPDNCSWETRATQAHNKRPQRRSKTGMSGVTWHKPHSKWRACITSCSKKTHLGTFDNLLDACCARKSAENKYWKGS